MSEGSPQHLIKMIKDCSFMSVEDMSCYYIKAFDESITNVYFIEINPAMGAIAVATSIAQIHTSSVTEQNVKEFSKMLIEHYLLTNQLYDEFDQSKPTMTTKQ